MKVLYSGEATVRKIAVCARARRAAVGSPLAGTEIAFTAPPAKRDEILSVARKTKTQVTEIGRVMKGAGAVLLNEDGHEIPLAKKGFTHF